MPGERLPPPPFWRLPYFEAAMSRPDRQDITADDILRTLGGPITQMRQADGRMRYWGWIEREARWLRVVVEPDGETVLNAFWDRRFKP